MSSTNTMAAGRFTRSDRPSLQAPPAGTLAAAVMVASMISACGSVTKEPKIYCGNDIRQSDQVCDGEDLADETCESLGYGSGELACLADCSGFDTSGCEETCMQTGCPTGVCDPESLECVDPWKLDCPASASESCSSQKPWFCHADGLPAYDCERCGCPDDRVCHEGFCYEPEVLDAERDERLPPVDLHLDRYFELYEQLISEPAITLPELSGQLDALLREDRRRASLMLGESHGSGDEQAVGVELMRGLRNDGWSISSLGIESNTLPPSLVEDMGIESFEIDGDLTNEAYCVAVVENASDTLNDENGVYVQYSGSGHTSRETAYHEQHLRISQVPHAAECLHRESRKAVTVILFDPAVWLMSTDQTLLWRIGGLFDSAESVSAKLDTSIDRWRLMMDQQVEDEKFDMVADGSEVNVRVVEARTPDVFFAYLPRPNRPAYFLESYRVIWGEDEIRDYLLSHDIRPENCSMSWNLTPGDEEIGFFCNKDDRSLSATVDATSFTLVDWSSN